MIDDNVNNEKSRSIEEGKLYDKSVDVTCENSSEDGFETWIWLCWG